jgi:lycopene cyclase domain-containing protein
VTYTALALAGVAVALAVDTVVLRTYLVRRRAFWTAYGIVLFFQLVVNAVLTGLPVVRYRAADIIGWRLAYAPVEDLLFGLALVGTPIGPRERRARQARTAAGSATTARRRADTTTRALNTS